MDDEKRMQAIGFLKSGANFTECAKKFNVDPSTIRRLYWKYDK